MVRVDHHSIAADRLAHRLDHLDVLAPVGVVEAQLDRPHPGVAQRDDAPRTLGRLHPLAARGVGEQPLRAPAEQPPQRLAHRPAGQVPDRHLGDPRAPAVEVDGLAQLPHHLRAARVEADEQPLEQRGVGQLVTARVALRAVLGADDDEGRLAARARLRVPRGAERRVERPRVAPDLDGGDAQAQSPR